MRHLLILAVLLLSACGPEDIPGNGYEPSAVQIAPATQGAQP